MSIYRGEEKVMDLYELLSVSRTATNKEIKRAYLTNAKELHPDRNPGDKNAEELFKKVNEAYTILSNKYIRMTVNPELLVDRVGIKHRLSM